MKIIPKHSLKEEKFFLEFLKIAVNNLRHIRKTGSTIQAPMIYFLLPACEEFLRNQSRVEAKHSSLASSIHRILLIGSRERLFSSTRML